MTGNFKEELFRTVDVAVDGCWIWSRASSAGYGVTWFRGRPQFAHRVAWILTHGDIDAGLCVLHRCDTPKCINPDHLFLGTNEENVADRVMKRRSARGERHGRVKLTPAQVQQARQRYASGETQKQIALSLGVVRSHIGRIVNRHNWQDA